MSEKAVNQPLPSVMVQAVGKVTKCRNSGASIVHIKAVSLNNRKEK